MECIGVPQRGLFLAAEYTAWNSNKKNGFDALTGERNENMKQRLFTTALLLALQTATATAQTPESFFPHGVGDRWDYWHSAFGYRSSVLTRDSIAPDGSHHLFYNNYDQPEFSIDTVYNVIWGPRATNGGSLLYKLAADSGEVWSLRPPPNFGGWAWVARVDSTFVFSHPTVVKVFRYNPQHPDTLGWNYYLEERHLASRFGLVYYYTEPAWVEYLVGCVIAGDTFGTLVSVPGFEEPLIPLEPQLRQNFPNPFNPTTTIEFQLPHAAIVSVRVYDLLGRVISTIVDGRVPPGLHRVRWDGSEFPSGVYLLRLSTPQGIQTRKMILLR